MGRAVLIVAHLYVFCLQITIAHFAFTHGIAGLCILAEAAATLTAYRFFMLANQPERTEHDDSDQV